MTKKIILGIVIIALAAFGWMWSTFFTDTTVFEGAGKNIIIPTQEATKSKVEQILTRDSLTSSPGAFMFLATQMKYWNKIKPGRYRIEKGMSIVDIIRLLRNGTQHPTRLVINKLRLREDLGKQLARAIEPKYDDIMAILNNPDSLRKAGMDTATWSAYIVPDTYEVLFTWSVMDILEKLGKNREKWWDKEDRRAKAKAHGLTETEVHIMASILEEETNKLEDKPLIASVYLNRIKRGMPLQADPTVRFARRDFASHRVYYTHLRYPSPYNTYMNRGLPPGPICTASPSSLQAVLDAPTTDYIFFVANADLRGGSTFTTNLADHSKAARVYQDSLTAWLKRKEARKKADSAATKSGQ